MMNNSTHTSPNPRKRVDPQFDSLSGQRPHAERKKQRTLRANTKRLLALLHRGGRYAHLWTDGGNRSYWFRVNARNNRRRRVPRPWLRHNIYFTVNPLSQIPPHNSSGRTDRRFISSQSEYICAVNALFAEFDGKDYVYTLEYNALLPSNFRALSRVEQQPIRKTCQERLFYRTPERFKRRALRHIEALHYPPSVIVDSGGGYHCYWLLRKTVPVDEVNRDDVEVTQHGWVQLVGGDSGAADLRRVLRLPGSYNHKSGFGEQPPRVEFIKANFGLLYDYQALEEAVNEWLYARERRLRWRRAWRNTQAQSAAGDDTTTTEEASDQVAMRRRFNAQHRIQDLLTAHGYRLCFAHRDQVRLARPGRDKLHSSVTIFPAQSNGTPEKSVHFSTNDPLYSQEYVDMATGKVRRQVHDAFSIYVMLEHDGDWGAAYRSVKRDT
ncbi:MAG: hypothetical protein KDE19_11300 [Caldilineaceae bacterium]|nr:hypothetical protein [Caldilineaceae bacterium]